MKKVLKIWIVGYANVPSVLPPAPAGRGLTRGQRLRRRVGRTLAGAGFVEVISFPFVGEAAFDALGLPADDVLRRTVRLANPLSSEEPSYTTTLLPGLFKQAARNLGRAPSMAWTGGRPRRSWPSSSRQSPSSRSSSRRSSPVRGSVQAGGVRGARPAGPTRSGWSIAWLTSSTWR